MNNACSVGLRFAGPCSRSLRWQSSCNPVLPKPLYSAPYSSRVTFLSTVRCAIWHASSRPKAQWIKSPTCNASRAFHQSVIHQILKPYDDKKERGLSFQAGYLRPEELTEIFQSDDLPPVQALNRLLRVLHGRRVDGTLDLALPTDLAELVEDYPETFEIGLSWLRETFPIDEDAAVVARLDREAAPEEQDNPSELMRRAEDLGIYKPQSGQYFAKLSEKEGDPYGESELDKIRAENEAAAEQEEQELQEQINKQIEEKEERQKSTAVAQRPESGIEPAQEIRPPNEYEKWVMRARNRAQSKLTLESSEIQDRTLLRRLGPSFILVVAVCGLSYAFAQWWTPPKRSDRIMPNYSLSMATMAGIVGANVTIFLLWRFPGAWRVLNTYFIVTPAYTRPLSLIFSGFSHQSLRHLFFNMAGLLIFGLPLHEEVGRGTFLAIYMASGVVGCFASLTNFALRGIHVTQSLGASGSVFGVAAARLWLHSDKTYTFFFIPEQWQKYISFQGWALLGVIALVELVGFLRPLKRIDHLSHIGGMVTGFSSAEYIKRTSQSTKDRKRESRRWYEHITGKKS